MSVPIPFVSGAILPIQSLFTEYREVGLVVASLIGFGFGFVLERSGFGRSTKLAGQFYLNDMTVLKVMFGAIVTAALGLGLFSGLGLIDLKAVSETATSNTFLWPMLIGGLVLGAGFIVSGYCPGTSIVASASGNVDGVVTVGGVVVGTVIYSELLPGIKAFHLSGDIGQKFFWNLTGIPQPVLAFGVAAMAVGAFMLAEKSEQIFSAKRGIELEHTGPGATFRRLATFGTFGALAAFAMATLVLPAPSAAVNGKVRRVAPAALAKRVLDEPWKLRILDLRGPKGCGKRPIPGSECVGLKRLSKIGLKYSAGARDLVLLKEGDLESVPKAALAWKGKIMVLTGGYRAWKSYALDKPKAPKGSAGRKELAAYRFRVALRAALTGKRAPAPVKASGTPYIPKRKKKKGGCS